jgi:hypothetical protein
MRSVTGFDNRLTNPGSLVLRKLHAPAGTCLDSSRALHLAGRIALESTHATLPLPRVLLLIARLAAYAALPFPRVLLLITRLAAQVALSLHRVLFLIARLAAHAALSLHPVPLRRLPAPATLLSTVLSLVHPIFVRAPVCSAAILRVPVLRAGLGLTVLLRARRILCAHASSASPLRVHAGTLVTALAHAFHRMFTAMRFGCRSRPGAAGSIVVHGLRSNQAGSRHKREGGDASQN